MEPQRLRRRKENLVPVTREPGFSRGAEGAAEKNVFAPQKHTFIAKINATPKAPREENLGFGTPET